MFLLLFFHYPILRTKPSKFTFKDKLLHILPNLHHFFLVRPRFTQIRCLSLFPWPKFAIITISPAKDLTTLSQAIECPSDPQEVTSWVTTKPATEQKCNKSHWVVKFPLVETTTKQSHRIKKYHNSTTEIKKNIFNFKSKL